MPIKLTLWKFPGFYNTDVSAMYVIMGVILYSAPTGNKFSECHFGEVVSNTSESFQLN